ncbi:MAG TPA: sterol desaturase family protein [Thermoanaerobaculia bacterium]|jgi:sterol desaturase/sphingolipid hydroxylase (fatty acid hydroxylase superfamily)|nr:sterol desaturase family protein [Thermoanaerobaculia bacterium]
MLLAERFAPLRSSVESKSRRVLRNLIIGGVSLALTPLLQAVFLQPVASWIVHDRVGLLQAANWPRWVQIAIAFVLLDYTLWWWHWANHRVPFFWRFHLVHHADRDLDTSTALRFHFVELALSIPVRAAQMIVIGVDPQTLWLWQTILFASILFHHANVRLPLAMERWLVRLIVTPRMHGIHHSDRLEETNTNYSSLVSVWDVLHRTLRLDVPQERVVIGVPGCDTPADVTIGKMLLLPFRRRGRQAAFTKAE